MSRMYTVSQRRPELFAIRCLLREVRGPTCFEDLRTFEGKVYPTAYDCCLARGIFESNELWVKTLQEAADERMGVRSFRSYFALTIVHGRPPNPKALFDEFVPRLVQRRKRESEDEMRERALRHLEYHFRQMGTNCREMNLDEPENYDETEIELENFNDHQQRPSDGTAPVTQQMREESARQMIESLNPGQRAAYDIIWASLNAPAGSNCPKLFHLEGEGGSGKSYVTNALIANCELLGHGVIPTSSTGVSALLVTGGTTAHSAFFIPIDLDAQTPPRLQYQSARAQRIRDAKLILIDEFTMLTNDVFEMIDRTIRSVMPEGPLRETPFGGKTIVPVGDFKQLCCVVPGQHRIGVTAKCIQKNTLYQSFTKLRLTQNMRANPKDVTFREWLWEIGNGLNWLPGTNKIEVPEKLMATDMADLIEFTFPEEALKEPVKEHTKFANNAILCPRKIDVDTLNSLVLAKLPGDKVTFTGIDRIQVSKNPLSVHAASAAEDRVHELTPGNLPPYKLELKVGAPVMITRNLSFAAGLCNGTRLQVKKLGDHNIFCKVLTGPAARSNVSIPRAVHEHGRDKRFKGTAFERLQFPLRLCAAMSINRGQGQTLNRVGVALNNHEVFSHGQIYTALSRVRNMDDIRVLSPTNQILNIVWEDLLTDTKLPVGQAQPQERMVGGGIYDEEFGEFDGTEAELMPNYDFGVDFETAELNWQRHFEQEALSRRDRHEEEFADVQQTSQSLPDQLYSMSLHDPHARRQPIPSPSATGSISGIEQMRHEESTHLSEDHQLLNEPGQSTLTDDQPLHLSPAQNTSTPLKSKSIFKKLRKAPAKLWGKLLTLTGKKSKQPEFVLQMDSESNFLEIIKPATENIILAALGVGSTSEGKTDVKHKQVAEVQMPSTVEPSEQAAPSRAEHLLLTNVANQQMRAERDAKQAQATEKVPQQQAAPSRDELLLRKNSEKQNAKRDPATAQAAEKVPQQKAVPSRAELLLQMNADNQKKRAERDAELAQSTVKAPQQKAESSRAELLLLMNAENQKMRAERDAKQAQATAKIQQMPTQHVRSEPIPAKGQKTQRSEERVPLFS